MSDPLTTEEYTLPPIIQEVANRSVFPHTIPMGPNGEAAHVHGLTKREYFAGMAMQGAMHALAIQSDDFEDNDPVDPHPIARDAVRMADALLKELAK